MSEFVGLPRDRANQVEQLFSIALGQPHLPPEELFAETLDALQGCDVLVEVNLALLQLVRKLSFCVRGGLLAESGVKKRKFVGM